MKKKIFFVFLLAIVSLLFFSFQYPENRSIMGDPPLSFEYQETKDSNVLVFRVTNISKDTVVFPLEYMYSDLSFEDKDIHRRHMISVKVAYPVTRPSFNEMPKKRQKEILKDFCDYFKDIVNLKILLPNDSAILSFDVREKDFANYTLRKEYKGIMQVYVSEELKKLCPRIWAGSLKANFPYTFHKP